ncbi:MAG: NTP transferase domain-containing protein, partial [Planctomycetes bacterium]|nr:NTP transferase domain-containing protein [Planctomycetota bacterium]
MSLDSDLKELSSAYDSKAAILAVILAAGHGKRIKSDKSKMLHEIWGLPTVERVHREVMKALPGGNAAVVVGVKAADVAGTVGRKKNTRYVLQKEQKGTGHAVQVALKDPGAFSAVRHCYVFPGDMGLLDVDEIRSFHKAFLRSDSDMMVLTGLFEGNPEDNYYGRIVRTKALTAEGKKSRYPGAVIEIKEHRDILSLAGDYRLTYRDETFIYTREELLAIAEFNSSVYAFRMKPLLDHIHCIGRDNAQGEIYLTDLIAMYNRSGLKVGARPASDSTVVLGFNNKSVLKEMDDIARQRTYEKLKDIVTFMDPDHFFLADEVVAGILALDRRGKPLDIVIGEGVRVSGGAKLNYGTRLDRNVTIRGGIVFGLGVRIGEGSTLATYPGQKIHLGDGVEVMVGDYLSGNIRILENSRIEGGVRITGSDEHPVLIGRNVS